MLLIFLLAISQVNGLGLQHINYPHTTDFCKHKCGTRLNICCIYGPGYGKSCMSRPYIYDFHDWETEVLLHSFNTVRNQVASGRSLRMDIRGITANNMNVLSYSAELAYSASCWAKQCTVNHSRCKAVEGGLVGETVCVAKAFNRKFRNVTLTMIQDCPLQFLLGFPHFTQKILDRLILPLGSDDERNRDSVQVIWAKTEYIGCSMSAFPNEEKGFSTVIMVCHYFPAGNIRDRSIFGRGKPCTECGNRMCNNMYSSLCGDVIPSSDDKWIPPMVHHNCSYMNQVALNIPLLLIFTFITK